MTVRHCLAGLEKAVQHGFVDLEHFDAGAYERMERIEFGDMNWVVKDRILAFSGPYEFSEVIDGVRTLTPDDYIPMFKDLHVDAVVRLNRPSYNKKRFTKSGLQFYDLYFPDGGLPECSGTSPT